MSFHYDEAIPPVRKQPANPSLRGKVSVAYTFDPFTFNVQEPTPEMNQGEFPDILSPGTVPLGFNESISGPSHTGKGKGRAITPFSRPDDPPSLVRSPPRSRRTSDETTPKPSPKRKDSIPVRKPRVSVEHKPLTVSCESCKSTHTISVSETDRTVVLSCNVAPSPPAPSPTVLELYQLPGYLTLNDKGQILVSTETELLSYVRKIFAPARPYKGFFPKDRTFNISQYDDLTDYSMTSTPDEARASYFLGHSKYLGSATGLETEPATPKATDQPPTPTPEQPKSEAPSRSQSRGPLEPYQPPAVPHGTKPTGYSPHGSGTASPVAFVQEVVPTTPVPPPPSSPKHASAARQASPRNLRSIGIFSDSEPDLPIPVKSESISIRIGSVRHSRSRSHSDVPQIVDPPTRHELYNQATEISRELSSARESYPRSGQDYYVQSREPSPRGRNSSRR
jgi:hypothetical protein